MGGGTWSASAYDAGTKHKIKTGSTFAYSTAVSSGAAPRAAHGTLDPKTKAGPSSPLAGKIVREARDSDDHPLSVPIAVLFDETGSMAHVPRVLQTKLADLFALLLRKGYVEDPQLLVGAYGDAEIDSVPLQVGQFESDNRADETLDNLFLEMGGGGNSHEHAALAWYYIGRHTATDAWDKRGKKGYLFTIGDETTGVISRSMVDAFIGDSSEFGEVAVLTPEQVLDIVKERWDVYHLVINNHTAKGQSSVEHYTGLLGDNCIVVQDENFVSEIIATAIGLAEGTTDLDEGLDNLDAIGAGAAKDTVSKALAKRGSAGGRVAVAEAPIDLDSDSGTDRL